MNVDYLPGARVDFDETYDWYSARSPTAANRFITAIDDALAVVVSNPLRFASDDGIHRLCPVRRFPFRIVYRIESDTIIVVAITHGSRSSTYWQDR
ncbi:type II toxin-antitoxin system RelE/ParE family toxin [Anatilimnocola sp. NA78]|uniref:type II toxin-antitoxin system RelE/ParE family toxin n=1 Tax=Anatilimnocola sp. NA78 TaxID=3415683 RepID=UPI003CE54FD5